MPRSSHGKLFFVLNDKLHFLTAKNPQNNKILRASHHTN
ncbi:hypothetical protein B4144_3463 [Bacillus atrophaeus]|nr:hypothetical protein B4144_3463 [Bacillus atrophaeus]